MYQGIKDDKFRAYMKEYMRKYRAGKGKEKAEEQKQRRKKNHQMERLTCLEHYSKGKMECECCGEKNVEFLCLNHIDGGGGKDRKEWKESKSGHRSQYGYLIENDFPTNLNVLCHNCNMSLGFYGYCPHQQIKYPENKMFESAEIFYDLFYSENPKTGVTENANLLRGIRCNEIKKIINHPVISESTQPHHVYGTDYKSTDIDLSPLREQGWTVLEGSHDDGLTDFNHGYGKLKGWINRDGKNHYKGNPTNAIVFVRSAGNLTRIAFQDSEQAQRFQNHFQLG